MFFIDVKGEEEVAAKIVLLNQFSQAAVKKQVNRAALAVQKGARERCPVDTGRLRSSIRVTFVDRMVRLTAEVGTTVEYAPYVEYGTRPHALPSGALTGWARRHGIPAYLVARAISQRGTPPRPFLYPAWEEERPRFLLAMQLAILEAERKAA